MNQRSQPQSRANGSRVGMKRTGAYPALTFGLSWAMAFGYFAAGGKPYSPSWLLMAVTFMFTPAIPRSGTVATACSGWRLAVPFRLRF